MTQFTKRSITLLLIFLLTVTIFTGCSSGTGSQNSEDTSESTSQPADEPSEETAEADKPENTGELLIRVGTLKGPAGMGMVGVMENAAQGAGANAYEFTMKSAPEDIRSMLINGELDIACLPSNVASVVYNKADQNISVLAVTTLGNLYILDREDSVNSIADLRGKTVYATGQGATPEYLLRYLLEQNGLNPETDLTLEFKSEHDELATLMIAGEVSLGMLPEPFVTTTTNQDEGLTVSLDLTEEWNKASNGIDLAMSCLVVTNEFLAEHEDAVIAFLEEFRQSTEFVNANVDEAAALMEKHDIIKAVVAVKAIPNCNIAYLDGEEMKSSVEGFLEVIYQANPQSVGGSLPDEAFYYTK